MKILECLICALSLSVLPLCLWAAGTIADSIKPDALIAVIAVMGIIALAATVCVCARLLAE